MKNSNFWGRIVAVAAVLLLASGGAALAQLQTGNLFGTVVDEQGSPLPGATVTLSGQAAPQVQVTNAQGQFRFLGLSPASYQLKAELEGFSTIEYPNVQINVGRNTQIEVTLSAAVEDVITVLGETPLLDERRISTGNTVSQTELEKIPTARDPWAILQSTPGVLTDRINVGGNESGQQSQYVGPGSGGDQAIWAVDGVVITDMAALGSSPAYYDFDSFEEMQVTTGGSDSTIATGGVVLNMVTKRGTNEWRGTGRYLVADESWQSDTDVSDDVLARAGPWNANATNPNGVNQARIDQGNRIVTVEDYGAEIGGPIVRDRLWIWGSYGTQQVDLLTIANVSDFTELETMNVKFNAQIAPSNSATLFALNSDKVKIGRNAGPFRPQETTWNQSKFGDDPTAAKLEDTHIFSSNFYLTGLYSIVNGGFQLAPQGGTDLATFLDIQGVWHNTFVLYQTERPQTQYKADASTFFNTGSLSHELKFGAGYREAEVASLSRWGGAGYYISSDYLGGDYGYLYAARDAFPAATNEYTNVYVQDTLSIGNLTANFGLRYDLQTGTNEARTVQANPIFPTLLPSVTYGGGDSGFEWESIVPRLGLTYALGAERKTLLRASYSRFADQLGIGATFQLNPLVLPSYVYLYVHNRVEPGGIITPGDIGDLNGNGVVDLEDAVGFGGYFNPITRGVLPINGVDPNLDPQMTDELLLSVEHALLPEFVVGLNVTYRQITDILEGELLVFDGDPYAPENINSLGRPHRPEDYELVTNTPAAPASRPRVLPDGTPYTQTYYQLRPGIESRGGTFLENGDREQEYTGVSATFNKRLANRWMVRGNFTWADWEWSKVPQSEIEDPTRFLGGGFEGEPVLYGSGTGSGSKGAVYINSEWSYSVNGLYQIAPDTPWGLNFALNLTGHQGYPLPYFERLGFNQRSGIPGFTRVQVVENEQIRLDDIHILDARLEKEFTFSDVGLTLGVDVFNVLNEGYVHQRNHRLRVSSSAANPLAPASDFVTEVTSPRIFRIGARLSFR
ncbi:MAG TPA: TonB-dependent receptor [Thermoanaerobaculia bacterium]